MRHLSPRGVWELTCHHADYAVVIIMGVFVFASTSWMVSARKWFHGPIKNIENGVETSKADESEYTETGDGR